jgi:hypothetical protein
MSLTTRRGGAKRSSMSVQAGRIQIRVVGRGALAILAAGMFLLAGGVKSALAQFPPSGQLEDFVYTVSNVKGPEFPSVLFTTGQAEGAGGSVSAQTGVLQGAEFLANAWELIHTGNDTLNARVDDWRFVTGATITGTATVPAGSSMTVTPTDTGQTIHLTNGPVSIPTGLHTLSAKPPKGGKQVVTCNGSARSCQARIELAGGAHNRQIVIRLTNASLALRSVKAPATRKHAAYSLTNGHFARGRSEYVVILSAARSSPPGSHLILTFTHSK